MAPKKRTVLVAAVAAAERIAVERKNEARKKNRLALVAAGRNSFNANAPADTKTTMFKFATAHCDTLFHREMAEHDASVELKEVADKAIARQKKEEIKAAQAKKQADAKAKQKAKRSFAKKKKNNAKLWEKQKLFDASHQVHGDARKAWRTLRRIASLLRWGNGFCFRYVSFSLTVFILAIVFFSEKLTYALFAFERWGEIV